MTATATPTTTPRPVTVVPKRTAAKRRRIRRLRAVRAATLVALAIAMTLVIVIFSLIVKAACGSKPAGYVPEAGTATPGTTAETTEAETDPPETAAPETAELETVLPAFVPDPADVDMLARLIWGEARGVKGTTQKAAVVWCVLNRVDASGYACGGDIKHVVTFPNQFVGYSESFPITAEFRAIAEDVLRRWNAEKEGAEDVGRVLPKGYIYFTGDGKTNSFTKEWKGGTVWDWSLPSPYEN